MVKILIDTCVWLDLAKDYQHETILSCLEELIQRQEVSLLTPRIVVEEFNLHKKELSKKVVKAFQVSSRELKML